MLWLCPRASTTSTTGAPSSPATCAVDPGAGDIGCSVIPRRRERLVKGLTRAGLTVVPEPAGPFVLAYHPQGQIVREKLREKGISRFTYWSIQRFTSAMRERGT